MALETLEAIKTRRVAKYTIRISQYLTIYYGLFWKQQDGHQQQAMSECIISFV